MRAYIIKITGYSSSQLTRLINKYQDQKVITPLQYKRYGFKTIYTEDDIDLLVKLDNSVVNTESEQI